MSQQHPQTTATTDDWRPRVVDPDAVWPGKCGHCGFQTEARACPRCGLHAGVEYFKSRGGTRPTATTILAAAAQEMQARAALYDQPEGERSVPAVVAAWCALTGRHMTESEGWLFLRLLKDRRLFSSPGFHADSAVDGVAYGALMSEARAREAKAG